MVKDKRAKYTLGLVQEIDKGLKQKITGSQTLSFRPRKVL